MSGSSQDDTIETGRLAENADGIDNDSKIVRVVASFKTAHYRVDGETEDNEVSSHSGISVDLHPEVSYWCSSP